MRHTIHSRHHWRWDNALAPAARLAPGDTVELDCLDPGGGQVHAGSTAADLGRLDFGRVNPVSGPLFIEGAEPGDAVKVTILDLAPSGWGWSALIPGFGLLAEDFPDPYLELWSYDRAARQPAAYAKGARVPLRPMLGSIGLAPARPGAHDILPPRRVGGTMDIRDMGPGAELILPVETTGGLLSVGDGHAAQGDGEVCGTGLETALGATLRVDLVKDARLRAPQFVVPGPLARRPDRWGYEATTGIGPSLMQGAVDAVRAMIDRLAARHGLTPEQAYVLCSLVADLRISEIVDRPHWVVSCYFPRAVFQ